MWKYLLLLVFIIFGCNQKVEKQPNVILVVVDDLGWKDVGFMGSSFYETPNIDRIADNGITFTSAYSASAVCSPTRAAIQTGRYPARVGINDWIRGSYSGYDPDNSKKYDDESYDTLKNAKLITPHNPHWMKHSEVTLAEILKENGYKTCHIGKWHLGFEDWFPESQGYDENYGGTDFGQPPKYFDPYESGKYTISNLPSKKNGEYLTDREGEEAVRFIERNKHKPFFLNLNHYAVHTPLQAKRSIIEKYIDKTVKDSTVKQWNAEIDNFREKARTKTPLDGQRNPVYAAMIESIDKAMGKIYEVLDKNSLTQNTIIIFTSDNGGHIVSTDNSPLKLGKGHSSEGGIRVPLAISFGNKIRVISNNIPISSIDLFPTICEMTGTHVPENLKVDGLSFKNVIHEVESNVDRKNLFWHFPHYWWGTKVKPYSIVLSDNWKLIKHWEELDFELYDLENDISETKNLVNKYPEKVKKLESLLNGWLSSINARLPKVK